MTKTASVPTPSSCVGKGGVESVANSDSGVWIPIVVGLGSQWLHMVVEFGILMVVGFKDPSGPLWGEGMVIVRLCGDTFSVFFCYLTTSWNICVNRLGQLH